MGAKNFCFYADDTNYDTKNDTVFGTIVDTKLHNYGSFMALERNNFKISEELR